MSLYSIGIDLGGTRIKAVVIDRQGTVLHQVYALTQDGNDRIWKENIAKVIRELSNHLDLQDAPVGISAPGIPNKTNTAIACMPGRMQGLEHFDWTSYLARPCYVLNDAVSALVAESTFGIALGKKHVVMLTLGTGVGGAILINGQPYQGSDGKAGHLGHIAIKDEGPPDITGLPGSLEDCIGNCTILQRTEGKYDSTEALLKAYRNGDPFAQKVWLTSVRHLAIGLASIINALSPELIVIGGGITAAESDLFDPLRAYMNTYEWRPFGTSIDIKKAIFGDLAGAIGAASYARQQKRLHQ